MGLPTQTAVRVITTYAGYFGAVAGIPFFALCLLGTLMTIHQTLAITTPMTLMANLSAAILFIIQGLVVC